MTDFIAILEDESRGARQLLQAAPPDAAVPACPGWSVDDLAWHLAAGQWGWGTMVADGLVDPTDWHTAELRRPTDHDELCALLTAASARLVAALQDAPAERAVWSWTGDATAAWVARRQAHEAVIHRVDALGVAQDPVHIDADLASDGVDEVLRGMFGWAAERGVFADRRSVRITATDTAATWVVQVGRLPVGETLDSGPGRGAALLRVDHHDAPLPTAAVSGPAEDLSLWLWNRRPPDALECMGDSDALQPLEQLVARGL